MDGDHKDRLITTSKDLLELEDDSRVKKPSALESLVITKRAKKALTKPTTRLIESSVLTRARDFMHKVSEGGIREPERIDLIGEEDEVADDGNGFVEMNLMLFEQQLQAEHSDDTDSESDSEEDILGTSDSSSDSEDDDVLENIDVDSDSDTSSEEQEDRVSAEVNNNQQ